MPIYVYGCGCGNTFERRASVEDATVECPICHNPARRRPFSGLPVIKGETVARSIPDPSYRNEAERRALNRAWGDASKSAELMRKHSHVDEHGTRQIDMGAMAQT